MGSEKYTRSFVIGFTGHRDALNFDVGEVERIILKINLEICDAHIYVLTGLAEGADKHVARVCMSLRDRSVPITPVAVLPMGRAEYEKDFTTKEASEEHAEMLRYFDDQKLPVISLDTADIRNDSYGNLADFIVEKSDMLVAAWDGLDPNKSGGTADVIKRFSTEGAVNLKSLDGQVIDFGNYLHNSESKPVYVIQTLRDSVEYEDESALNNGFFSWVPKWNSSLKIGDGVVSQFYPKRLIEKFEFINQVGVDSEKFLRNDSIANYPGPPELIESFPGGGGRVSYLLKQYSLYDRLASAIQKPVHRHHRHVSVFTIVIALSFLVYAKIAPHVGFLIAYVVLFGAAYARHKILDPNRLKPRYTLYRAIAEALRVEYFLTVSGVVDDKGKNSLSKSLTTKGKVAGNIVRSVLQPAFLFPAEGKTLMLIGYLDLRAAWIDDQQIYYKGKSRDYHSQLHNAERFITASIYIPIALAVALAVMYAMHSSLMYIELFAVPLKNYMAFAVGFLPVIGAVLEIYTNAMAKKELASQYGIQFSYLERFMEFLGDSPPEKQWHDAVKYVGESLSAEHMLWLKTLEEKHIEVAHGG
jgi:hypothetical protein